MSHNTRRLLAAAALISAAEGSWADDYTPGVWSTWAEEKTLSAFVYNESKGMLFKRCSKASLSCFWAMSIQMPCKDDDVIPMLISSRLGAFSIEATCLGASNDGIRYRYSLPDQSLMDPPVFAGGVIGFAYVLKSGLFEVSRFNVEGGKAAVQAVSGVLLKKLGGAAKVGVDQL